MFQCLIQPFQKFQKKLLFILGMVINIFIDFVNNYLPITFAYPIIKAYIKSKFGCTIKSIFCGIYLFKISQQQIIVLLIYPQSFIVAMPFFSLGIPIFFITFFTFKTIFSFFTFTKSAIAYYFITKWTCIVCFSFCCVTIFAFIIFI